MPATPPTFKEALRFWLKLGFISFGGPAGQIAIMYAYVVEQKKWLPDHRFMHALNYCMLLPGPEAQQLATYIGWLLHGIRGGLAAGILFVLPSVFILLGLSIAYVNFGSIPWVYALFNGLKPAVVAIVVAALLRIGKKALQRPLHYLLALFSFIALFFFNIPFPVIIIGAIVVAVISLRFFPSFFGKQPENEPQTQALPAGRLNLVRPVKQTVVAFTLWVLPLVLLFYTTSDFIFWQQMAFFFTKAAFVTFGGAYAVLPYVAQVSVEKLNWLTEYEMLDGLALGETTPGPLIMVLVFVGFMGGYHHSGNSIWAGTLGLLLTTFYTFLPCFLFILVGAPLVERTQQNLKVKAVLSIITAAVTGVILNLAVYLGRAVIFPDQLAVAGIAWFNVVWLLVSGVALYKFKVNLIAWIAVSAVAGLMHYLLF